MMAMGTCAAFTGHYYIPGATVPLPISRGPQEAAHMMALYSSKETETQGGETACPRTHSQEVAEPGSEPAPAGLKRLCSHFGLLNFPEGK